MSNELVMVNRIKKQNENNEKKQEEKSGPGLLKGDLSRFVDYSFGNVKTQTIEIEGNLIMSGIAIGSPIDGGTVNIPTQCSVVLIQNTSPYTQLTMNMPLEPTFGQVLMLISTVSIPNLALEGSTFGSVAPNSLSTTTPIRLLYVGSWYSF